MITRITVRGNNVDLANVDYSVRVTHGRSDITDGPTASSAALTVHSTAETLPRVFVGDLLEIYNDGELRFTGRITDVALTHMGKGFGQIKGTAIGNVARLGTKVIGDVPWDVQTSGDRVKTILDLTDHTYLINGGQSTRQAAQDVDSRKVLDLIGAIATDAGAAVVDLPDGRILVDFLDDRGTEKTPVVLPATHVVWEPTWNAVSSQIVNHVSATIPTPENPTHPIKAVYSDAESIAEFGRRHVVISTGLADVESAEFRARSIVQRQRNPFWKLAGVEVLLELLEPEIRSQVTALVCGDKITLSELPTPAPATTVTGTVEGWSHDYTPNRETLSLALTVEVQNDAPARPGVENLRIYQANFPAVDLFLCWEPPLDPPAEVTGYEGTYDQKMFTNGEYDEYGTYDWGGAGDFNPEYLSGRMVDVSGSISMASMYSVYTITPVYADGTRGETKTISYPPPNENTYSVSWQGRQVTATWGGDVPPWIVQPSGVSATPSKNTSSAPGTVVFTISGTNKPNIRFEDGSRIRTNHYLPALDDSSSGSTDNTLRVIAKDSAGIIGVEPTGGVPPFRVQTGITGDFERFIPQPGTTITWDAPEPGTYQAKIIDAVGTQVVRTYTV